MQSNNPVLSRYEKTDKSGFAYDEGVNAYTQAATGGAGAAARTTSPSDRPVPLRAAHDGRRHNTITGRLTEPMLDEVLARARDAAGL
jgi:hypothetical protein